MPNSARPKDLVNSEKLLYSKKKANLNQPTENNYLNSSYKTKFGLPLESFRTFHSTENLKRSKSIHGVFFIILICFIIDFNLTIKFNLKRTCWKILKSQYRYIYLI
jgi:hypothetical protein